LLGQHAGGSLARSVSAVGSVLRAVLVFRDTGGQTREIVEDGFRSLEPLAITVREQRDLVLAVPILLSRRHLPGDEVDAELGQPLAHGGRVRAPLGLVQREHGGMFDAVRVS
jgi:hypothetical protein